MGKNSFLGAKGTSLFKYIVTLTIVFQISIGSTILHAADGDTSQTKSKGYSVFLPPELANLAAEDFLKNDTQFNENEKAFIEKYFNEPARVTLDLMILARALIEKANATPDAIDKIKSRNSGAEIVVEVPGIGKAEFNSLGYEDSGKVFTRFVHYKTETSYVYIDEKIVPLNKLTEADKIELGVKESIDEERARSETRAELDRYTALQQMHTKVQPAEYNPFPNLQEINPEEAKGFLEALIEDAKNNPPKKNYDTSKKIKTGRLVKIITYDGEAQVVKSISEHQRYEDLSPMQRVKIYWRSIKQGTRLNTEYLDHEKFYKKPLTYLTGDAFVSLLSTAGQSLVFLSLKGFNVDLVSMIMVAGWAFAFSITPTFRNWINVNPSKSSVLFKSFLNSVVFNYVLLTAIHGADVVFSMSTTAFNLAFLSITNAVINNFGKVWWYKIPQMRQRAGLNLRKINNIGPLRVKVDQSSLEQQAWYLGSNVFRTADLVAMGTLFTVLGLEFTLSRVALLLSIPAMHFIITKYAEKKDFKEKNVLRQEWERANYLHWNEKPVTIKGYRIPIFYLGSAKMFAQETWLIAKSSFMLLYWPVKVSADSLVNTFNTIAEKIKPSTRASETVLAGGSCKNLFQ